jgi:hypothetical protein
MNSQAHHFGGKHYLHLLGERVSQHTVRKQQATYRKVLYMAPPEQFPYLLMLVYYWQRQIKSGKYSSNSLKNVCLYQAAEALEL